MEATNCEEGEKERAKTDDETYDMLCDDDKLDELRFKYLISGSESKETVGKGGEGEEPAAAGRNAAKEVSRVIDSINTPVI